MNRFTPTGLILVALLVVLATVWWKRSAGPESNATRATTKSATPPTPAQPQGTAATPKPAGLPAVAPNAPEPVKSFRDWSNDYRTAAPDERAAMLAKGAALAEAHTREIAVLIRKDPRAAIENAVPMVIRQDLPASIVALLEDRVSMKAALNVYGNVPLPGSEPAPDFEPYTRSVTTEDGQYWNAFVYGRRAAQRTLSLASLNGISVGADMAIAESPVRQLEHGERPNTAGREVVESCPVSGQATPVERTTQGALPAVTEETPAYETPERIVYVCSGGHIEQVIEKLMEEEYRAHWESQGVYLEAGAGTGSGTAPVGSIPGSWTTGHRKFLYIRATFPDHLVDPQTEAESHDMLRQMADYVTQTSYGRCYFTYAVAPLVVLPYPESWYIARQASPGGGDTLVQGHARTIAKAMGFDYLSYDLDAVRWAGTVGSYGGSASVGARGMRMKTSGAGTFIHELGHNLGVWHANFWRTTPPSFTGPGNNLEYGNTFDVMGSSGSVGQFTAHFKNILNWLPPETHWNVTSSGVYRLHQFDYAVAHPSFRYALRITKDAERQYWAEFRQRFTSNVGLMNGLMMTWDGWGQGGIGGSGGSPPDGSNRGAQLLDMTPGSFGNGITDTRNDSALWVGRTYSDPDANIHITPIAKNTNSTPPSMDVMVTVGPVPGNQPPALAITASTNAAGTGVVITLTATASDPDGDALAYAWVFDDGTYSTNSNAVQTKSWSTAGHYQVLCTASDMKGKRTTRAVRITVGSPTTFTVSGNITGPDALPLEGVYVANYTPSSATTHPNSGTFRGTWTDSDGNYTLTRLNVGSYSITPNLYPNVFTPDGFANPVAVGPNATNINFTSESLPTVTLNITDATANEGPAPGTGTVRIERTGSTDAALEVQIFNASTGNAIRNTDYTLSPAPTASTNGGGNGTSLYRIPAGATFLDVTVSPSNDATAEGTEYAVLDFANTSGGYLLAGAATAVVEIIDDENPNLPVVKLLAPDNVAAESGSDDATLRLERVGNTTTNLSVTLTFSGTATSGSDYVLTSVIVIPAGTNSAAFALTPIDDTTQEGTETAIVTIATSSAYARDALSNTQTNLIHDNDLPTVTVTATDATATETPGDSATFSISRAGGDPTQPLTVDYALAGRAVHGADYRRLDGRAIIPPGVLTTRVEIQPLDDTVDEGTQDVILLLRSATTYIIGGSGTATVNITDNEASQVYLKLTTSAGTEPASGSSTAVAFQIIRPASGSAIVVNYSISGTATSGVDFTALPGTNAFTAGDTNKTINVSALADAEFEDAESVTLTLLPGTGYTVMASQPDFATGFILDGDQPSVDVSVADTVTALTTPGSETSTGTTLRFLVARKTATASELIVNYTMAGTATEGVDYTGTTGTVTIPANTTTNYVIITAVNDTTPEGVETIIMNLTPAPGTYSLRTASATMLLADNDAFPSGTVGFAVTNSAVTESIGTHDVPVRITGTPAGTVTVQYRVSAGTATGSGYDFTLADGVLEFLPGVSNLVIPVTIHQDILPEPAETIVLQLFNAIGANLGASTHTNTITNLSMPEAFTDAATNLLADGATLKGRALPNGVATDVWFQYGPTVAYGSNSAPQAAGSGTNFFNASAAIAGFAPGGYHFRCVASNGMGVTYGIDQVIPSANALLTNLTLSAGVLAPVFNSGNATYTAVVGNGISALTATPTAADGAAAIKINGANVPSGYASIPIALAVGSNVLTAVVTSPDRNVTNTYAITVTRQTAYETWADGHGLTGLNSAPDEDFDGDGGSNFMEFALNTDPKVPSAELFPYLISTVNPADDESYATMVHRRRIDPGTLTYTIRASLDMTTWTNVPAGQLEQVGPPAPVGDGVTEVMTIRIAPSIQDSTAPRFFHLWINE
jgi:Cadherin-like beta sandwich domain/Calx-beta domain/PKD domain